MRINIAICDDESVEIDYISHLLKSWSESRSVSIGVSAFSSAEAFLFVYEANKAFDILLLDIQMKEMDGITLAQTLRTHDTSTQIIFITGFPDFMAKGYDVSALHYLLKPVSEAKLFEVLDKARENLSRTEKMLFVTIDGEMHRIPASKIRFIEAQGHYILLHTVSGIFKAKMNLSDVAAELGDGFFRCQRSFIVNLVYIKKIMRTAITIDDSTEIPLSRSLYDAANRAAIEYFP